ncbi:hypothetical protein ACFX1R_008193 [Malus domestica]
MLLGKIPHLLEEQIGQSALYSGGNQKTLQLSSRISLWGEGEQSAGALIAYLVSSSEIDTLPCASPPVKDTTPWMEEEYFQRRCHIYL